MAVRESTRLVSRRRRSAQEKRTRRNAAARQGFDEVVVSDASVPGDGEVKCVEYLDACAREAARSGDPRPRDVVLYGGDVDLVVMALCRAQPGPGPVFGPHVRSILVLSDAGRVLDVGALADALCARVARKNDEEDPTLERRQVALDFATLAVAAGGNDYLPPLSVASHALWDAYKAQDRALYDETSGKVDLEVLGSLLEDRHVPASRDLGTAALVSAQTWTRPPRDTLDRVERAAPHSNLERPRIEGRLNVDFHTGTTPRRSTKNGDASRRTLGVILERKTGDRRRLERWN